MNKISDSKAIAIERTTWGKWVVDINNVTKGMKIIESGLSMVLIVLKGPYHEDYKNHIETYKYKNLKRTDIDLPCKKNGTKPCYNILFTCAFSKNSESKNSRSYNAVTIQYPQSIPPDDALIIWQENSELVCKIKRRSQCKILKQKELYCPRTISGILSEVSTGDYFINISLSETCAQDLLN